jgi:hypothetical protein
VASPFNARALGAVIVLVATLSCLASFNRGWWRRLLLLCGVALLMPGIQPWGPILSWAREAPGHAFPFLAVVTMAAFLAILLLPQPEVGRLARAAGFIGALGAIAGLATASARGDPAALLTECVDGAARHGTALVGSVFCAACAHLVLRPSR